MSKKLNPKVFIPEKNWSGIITETKLKNTGDDLEINYYNYTINIINYHENSIQVAISYKKVNESIYKREFANLYILHDGSIRGQDANGQIDGRIIERDKERYMELVYRSYENKNYIISYYGELKFKT